MKSQIQEKVHKGKIRHFIRSSSTWTQLNKTQHNTTQHNTTQHNTIQHNIAHNTIQHNTIHLNASHQSHSQQQYNIMPLTRSTPTRGSPRRGSMSIGVGIPAGGAIDYSPLIASDGTPNPDRNRWWVYPSSFVFRIYYSSHAHEHVSFPQSIPPSSRAASAI